MQDFMHAIYHGPLGNSLSNTETSGDNVYTTPKYDPYRDDIKGDEPTMLESDSFTIDAFNKYIGAQLDLRLHDAMTHATVVARQKDEEENPVGRSNANPLLDMRIYHVLFPGGSTNEYTANVIAENMYSQVGKEGHQFNILSELIDHRKNSDALGTGNTSITLQGQQHPVCTTKGWQLCVQWQDDSTIWEDLKNLKEANPIETTEYAALTHP
jgi:hypothetical protein